MTERIALEWNELKTLMDATTAIHKIYQSPLFQCCFFTDLDFDPLLEFADNDGVIYKIHEAIMKKLHPNASFYEISVMMHSILKKYKSTDNYPKVLRFLEKIGTLA
jgi:hypothetical protein